MSLLNGSGHLKCNEPAGVQSALREGITYTFPHMHRHNHCIQWFCILVTCNSQHYELSGQYLPYSWQYSPVTDRHDFQLVHSHLTYLVKNAACRTCLAHNTWLTISGSSLRPSDAEVGTVCQMQVKACKSTVCCSTGRRSRHASAVAGRSTKSPTQTHRKLKQTCTADAEMTNEAQQNAHANPRYGTLQNTPEDGYPELQYAQHVQHVYLRQDAHQADAQMICSNLLAETSLGQTIMSHVHAYVPRLQNANCSAMAYGLRHSKLSLEKAEA